MEILMGASASRGRKGGDVSKQDILGHLNPDVINSRVGRSPSDGPENALGRVEAVLGVGVAAGFTKHNLYFWGIGSHIIKDRAESINTAGDKGVVHKANTSTSSYGPQPTPTKSAPTRTSRSLEKYKGLRIVSDDYSFYYSVWCANELELYRMVEGEYQMHDLLPNTLDIKNITDGPLLGRNLGQVTLDALMMVLKTCSGNECVRLQLHPQGDVQTLQEAMSSLTSLSLSAEGFFSACKLGYLPKYGGPEKALQYQG
ncbi:arylsulfatase, putative [Talaromyces islandicus]|uniref:Arylsulfatase, putative n=1 Tax=Talaromyces islandicus TaxID=28573 RepID=A0A0U1M1T5_TALIS|nr:arylsulfatase, putative [Talaromyces islandicus]